MFNPWDVVHTKAMQTDRNATRNGARELLTVLGASYRVCMHCVET